MVDVRTAELILYNIMNRENFHDSIFNTYVAMLIQHDGF